MYLAFIFLYLLLLSAKSLCTADLNELVKINASVDCILKSTVSAPNSDSIYFWDSLNPVIRFAILNQSQVLALSFDIQRAIINDVNSLNWTDIPSEIQTFLIQQRSSILYLKFSDWGWSDSDRTVYSLISNQGKYMLPIVEPLLELLSYDLIIDLNKLKTILTSTYQPFHHEIRPYHHLMQHFDKISHKEYEAYYDINKMFFQNFFNYFKPWILDSLDLKSKRRSAASIFAYSIQRIDLLLKDYNINY